MLCFLGRAAASSPEAGLRLFQCAYHRSNEMLSPTCEDQEVSYGLNWAIAGRGVVVKDKVFHNLETSELQKEHLSGIPLHVRGNVIGGVPDVSKAQFAKHLKLVTVHLSSISNLYIHDGAVGSSIECDAKQQTLNALSLILCGKAFADSTIVKDAPTALTAPILLARGGLLVARCTDAIPSLSKLSPNQAAYHFLAGCHDGKFALAYSRGPSPVDPLALASSLFSHLKEYYTPAYLINAKHSGKYIDDKEFIKLLELALPDNLPDIKTEDIRVGELKGKYRSFLFSKFGKYLPGEFSF